MSNGIGILMILAFVVLASIFVSACGANENILHSGREKPAETISETDKTPVSKELEGMRTAGFAFIYVIRRQDGGKLDADDRSLIRIRTAGTNRRVTADEGRAVIIGSSFEISQNNLAELYKRLSVENYSEQPTVGSGTDVNSTK